MRALAADKNGVSPNTISLPKGPGSIEGLGESFQPSLNTGTAKYSVALKVPPGTASHAPSLRLTYEAGAGNGPLGYGWLIAVGSVQRKTDRGIPTYGENVELDRSDTFINEMKEELVALTNGFYFCKNEGAFIRYRQTNDYWVGVLPNGTRMEFGVTPEGRIEDTNTVPPHVFCWLLERETDIHGNTTACTQTVIVLDNQSPAIACPPTVTVNADPGTCAATGVALGRPVTTDNCGVASVTSNAPASFPVGTNTVTWTAIDTHGNASAQIIQLCVGASLRMHAPCQRNFAPHPVTE